MASVWSLHSHRRKNGDCHFCDQEVFYLHFISHAGFAGHLLFNFCFLDECEKLYPEHKKKSPPLPITLLSKLNHFARYLGSASLVKYVHPVSKLFFAKSGSLGKVSNPSWVNVNKVFSPRASNSHVKSESPS